jgi:hypothetical protein
MISQATLAVDPLPIPEVVGRRSAEDHEYMRVMHQHVTVCNEIILKLQAELTFLLPHAAEQILYGQLAKENPNVQDLKDSFMAVATLTEPRLPKAVKDVVEQNRIDLLEKFFK